MKEIAGGDVPNLFAALGYLAPAPLSVVLNAEGALAEGSLNKKDLETIKLVVSELTGCDYCIAAHVMLGKIVGLSAESISRIRAGEPTGEAMRDDLVAFVRKLHLTSGTISQADFDAIRAEQYTETQLADISLVIALAVFTNTFNRINDTTLDVPAVK